MFVGEFQHAVDEKGRIVLPRKFRDDLDRGCVITKGQERCLYVFTVPRWNEEAERVSRLPRTDKTNRGYARAFFSGSSDQKPDRQGRIQIPEVLRQYAGVTKEVTVVGVGERVEIWSTDAWNGIADDLDSAYSGIEEALSDQGI